MKSITLINPPSPWLISDQVELPLGILYLASFVREKGIDVRFLDLSGDLMEKEYNIPKADLYGVGFVSPQSIYAKQILNRIKREDPFAPVIAGGAHPTALPSHTLSLGFDSIVRGEGEIAMEQIMAEGLEKRVYELVYVEDLNSLPIPAFDLINMEAYVGDLGVVGYMNSGKAEVEREINIMATRGCPGICAYCTQFKGPLRWRDTDKVMDEIKYLESTYGVNRIFFVDDNLIINKKWLSNLTSKLKEHRVKWHCLGRADQVDYNICKEMVDSGCMGIDFGIESGSQRILDIIQKRITIEKQERGIRAAYDAGVKVRAQFMVGLPQEEEEDHRRNLEFIERNNQYVAKWGIHIFVPYPSCEIWHNPEKFGYSIDKNTDFSNFQTIGKPGEWNFVPKENQEEIARRRDELLSLINEKNIFVER